MSVVTVYWGVTTNKDQTWIRLYKTSTGKLHNALTCPCNYCFEVEALVSLFYFLLLLKKHICVCINRTFLRHGIWRFPKKQRIVPYLIRKLTREKEVCQPQQVLKVKAPQKPRVRQRWPRSWPAWRSGLVSAWQWPCKWFLRRYSVECIWPNCVINGWLLSWKLSVISWRNLPRSPWWNQRRETSWKRKKEPKKRTLRD